MSPWSASLPRTSSYRLKNATVPVYCLENPAGFAAHEGLARADLAVSNGRLTEIAPHRPTAEAVAEAEALDLGGAMVWPGFVDMHTHLDKGHIWPRSANQDGTFQGAIHAVLQDRGSRWTEEDLAARMEFSLQSALSHGTRLIRTHLDCPPGRTAASWEVFAQLRETWQDKIALQAVALTMLDALDTPAYFDEVLGAVTKHSGVLGACPQMNPDLEGQLERFLRAADARGLDVDLHVDETLDPNATVLLKLADAVLATKFSGRVTAGHCCALSQYPSALAERTIARVAEAGISIVSLPMCNLYLQDRGLGTPRQRGVTLLQELGAAGVQTAIASDNIRDPFYAYGDLDMLEVLREGVRILHLDHPLDQAAGFVTRAPAQICGAPEFGALTLGGAADFVLFNARSWSELLSRPQSDRVVMRRGLAIEAPLPDYRMLDGLYAPAN